MRLNILYSSQNDYNIYLCNLLKAAANKLGIEITEHELEGFDFINPPLLGKDDLWYRITSGTKANRIEKIVINDAVTSFYSDWKTALATRSPSFFYHEKFGLPSIKTIPVIPESRDELDRYVTYLGGFPILLKVTGNKKGIGVMRLDSMKSLRSVLDYVKDNKRAILRQYIDHEYYARLIVVGDRVVASNKTLVPENDFRTNTVDNVEENRFPEVFSDEIQQIAIAAVKVLGLENGGVDLLFDKENRPYIAEVNFPCQFGYAQEITGIDVAWEMVHYLVEKQQRNH